MSTLRSHELPNAQALILAGGQGERLLPLTRFRAKAAVPFGGAFRIIDFTLTNCLKSGLTDVSLLTQHLHEDLESYIRQTWSEPWTLSRENREPLVCLPPASGKRYRGTADAVLHNLPMISGKGSQHVLILSGDHVYRMDYRKLLRRHVDTDADMTISTIEHPVEDAKALGVVEVDRDLRVTGFSEKPSRPRSVPHRPNTALVSMGVYVFKMRTLVDVLQRICGQGLGDDFGRDVIPSLLDSGRVYAYNFYDKASKAPCYWRDIGTIDSYHAASMELIRWDSPFVRPATKMAWRVSINARLYGAVISDGVRIEDDALVRNSVLMPGVRVGKGARLSRVIVGEGVQIPAGFGAGWDLESDRKHHTVTPGGVVVISETPRLGERIPLRFSREGSTAFAPQ